MKRDLAYELRDVIVLIYKKSSTEIKFTSKIYGPITETDKISQAIQMLARYFRYRYLWLIAQLLYYWNLKKI